MANTTRKTTDKENLLQIIINALSEKKAKDIVSLDLREIKVAIADYFVVAHGDSNTQVNALHQSVLKTAREQGYRAYHDEGKQNGEWIIIDFIDIVVHIFHREKRDFYQLEDLWHDAPSIQYAEDGKAKEDKKSNSKSRKKVIEPIIDDKPFVDKLAIVKSPRKVYAKKFVAKSVTPKKNIQSTDEVDGTSTLKTQKSAVVKVPRKSYEKKTVSTSVAPKRTKISDDKIDKSTKVKPSKSAEVKLPQRSQEAKSVSKPTAPKTTRKTSKNTVVSKVLKSEKLTNDKVKKETIKKSVKPSVKSIVENKISKNTK